jgi:HlyD family secretion protein
MTNRHAQGNVRWILAIVITIVIALGAGYLLLRWARPLVTVSEVVEGPVVQAFYSTGTIEPQREYPIKSNTAGTLTEVRVDKGDLVTRGQALAVVADPALMFTANKAQAELDEKLKRADEKASPVLQEFDARLKGAQELLEIAQREVKRISDLMQSSAGAQNDLDRAMDRAKLLLTEAESIKAQRAAKKLELEREVQVARSALNIATWNLEEQTLKSPIDGVVLDRPTSVGTRVAVNDPIMRVADVRPENLVMRADVDEEDITKVHVDQEVQVVLYAFPGRALGGKVARIYDQADVDRRTFEVDVRLDEAHKRLAPGMTGELAFIMAAKDKALVVPSQAVQGGAVYVVRDQRLVKTDAIVGLRSVERSEIVSGLRPGDRVVISSVGEMQPGQVVRTKWLDPVTAAGLNRKPVEEQPFKAFD